MKITLHRSYQDELEKLKDQLAVQGSRFVVVSRRRDDLFSMNVFKATEIFFRLNPGVNWLLYSYVMDRICLVAPKVVLAYQVDSEGEDVLPAAPFKNETVITSFIDVATRLVKNDSESVKLIKRYWEAVKSDKDPEIHYKIQGAFVSQFLNFVNGLNISDKEKLDFDRMKWGEKTIAIGDWLDRGEAKLAEKLKTMVVSVDNDWELARSYCALMGKYLGPIGLLYRARHLLQDWEGAYVRMDQREIVIASAFSIFCSDGVVGIAKPQLKGDTIEEQLINENKRRLGILKPLEVRKRFW